MKIQRDALMHATEGSERAGQDAKQPGALTPLHRFTDIFDKSIDRLGLLKPDEVAAVLDAYLPLKELTSKIRLMELRVPPHERRVEYGEGPPQDYAVIAHSDVPVLGQLHSVYVPSFDKAIEKLGSNVRSKAVLRIIFEAV